METILDSKCEVYEIRSDVSAVSLGKMEMACLKINTYPDVTAGLIRTFQVISDFLGRARDEAGCNATFRLGGLF